MHRALFLTDDHGRGKVLLDEEIVASAQEAWDKGGVRDPMLLARIAGHTAKGAARTVDPDHTPALVDTPEGTILVVRWADGQEARLLMAVPSTPVVPRKGARLFV